MPSPSEMQREAEWFNVCDTCQGKTTVRHYLHSIGCFVDMGCPKCHGEVLDPQREEASEAS